MSRVLVTGANGFVGAALLPALRVAGHTVRAALWEPDPAFPDGVVVGDIGPDTDWRTALDGIDAVIHLAAARVHIMRDTAADPSAEISPHQHRGHAPPGRGGRGGGGSSASC